MLKKQRQKQLHRATQTQAAWDRKTVKAKPSSWIIKTEASPKEDKLQKDNERSDEKTAQEERTLKLLAWSRTQSAHTDSHIFPPELPQAVSWSRFVVKIRTPCKEEKEENKEKWSRPKVYVIW
jgi:hypothetical protein